MEWWFIYNWIWPMKFLQSLIFSMVSDTQNVCMVIYSGFTDFFCEARSEVSKATTWIEILKPHIAIIGLADISVLSLYQLDLLRNRSWPQHHLKRLCGNIEKSIIVITNIYVIQWNLSIADTFGRSWRCPLYTGFTVFLISYRTATIHRHNFVP